MRGLDVRATFTRDFPYDWAALVENVMDPSHIPFAHHGLQGDRSDAVPIDVSDVKVAESGFRFVSADKTMGKARVGTSQFDAPYLVKYMSHFVNTSSTFNVTLLCIPHDAGSCRAILLTTRSTAPSRFATLMQLVPVWIVHILSNRFLDSDLIFLHGQDANVRDAANRHSMPAPCDVSTRLLTRYLKTIEYIRPILPTFARSRTRRELLDRWHTHTLHCRHCMQAYKRIETTRFMLHCLTAAAALARSLCVSVACILASVALEQLRQRFHHVDFQYTEM